MFSLLVRPAGIRARIFRFPTPLVIARTRYNIKEFSSAVGGGCDKEKERTVVLGKSGRMVIFPLPDVQNHASPRPPSPLTCSSPPNLSYRHSFLLSGLLLSLFFLRHFLSLATKTFSRGRRSGESVKSTRTAFYFRSIFLSRDGVESRKRGDFLSIRILFRVLFRKLKFDRA